MKRIVWLFGLPGSGKTTLASAWRDHLQATGERTIVLDGDELRSGVCADLGFSDADRSENLRRAAHIARLLHAQGSHVVCAFVTPRSHHRALVKAILGDALVLVHVHCPLSICVQRDPKKLYAKAATQQMVGLTGAQDAFDAGCDADLTLHTDASSVRECVEQLEIATKRETTPLTAVWRTGSS